MLFTLISRFISFFFLSLFFVYVSLSYFTNFIHIINFIYLIVYSRFFSIVLQKILPLIIPTENISNFFSNLHSIIVSLLIFLTPRLFFNYICYIYSFKYWFVFFCFLCRVLIFSLCVHCYVLMSFLLSTFSCSFFFIFKVNIFFQFSFFFFFSF